tara:strand:- start:2400 stop:3377 length:978 start_codon:yes stop_codon:yes gene_type:complete
MIIKYFEIDKTDLNKSNFYLFYGKNDGLQNEIIKKSFINNFKGNINKYDEKEFIENYNIIATEVLTKSLFESEKIIIISRTSEKILKLIQEIIERDIKDIKFILKSGILEKKSKLRNYFEKNENLVIVPFYEDDDNSLSTIALNFIRKNNIKMSRESLNLIVNRANGNRENLKNDLEKIFNFSITNKNIDYENIIKLTNLSENYGVNKLADSYLEKNIKSTSKILNENIFTEQDCVLIIRSILSKSKRLMNIIEIYNETKDLDEAIMSAKPPVFWKDKISVKKQAKTWVLSELKNKIYEINDIETLIKINSRNSINLISDFVINY